MNAVQQAVIAFCVGIGIIERLFGVNKIVIGEAGLRVSTNCGLKIGTQLYFSISLKMVQMGESSSIRLQDLNFI